MIRPGNRRLLVRATTDRPFLNVGDYQVDPLTTVTALFERGTAQEGDVAIDSTKAYCEMICRMQRLWLDGTLLGTYESMSALRTSMTPDAKLAGVAGRAVAAGGEGRQDAVAGVAGFHAPTASTRSSASWRRFIRRSQQDAA